MGIVRTGLGGHSAAAPGAGGDQGLENEKDHEYRENENTGENVNGLNKQKHG